MPPLLSTERRGARRNEWEEENNSKCWFFSFHISFLSHHFICPPTPRSPFHRLSLSRSLSLSALSLYPFSLSTPSVALSLFLYLSPSSLSLYPFSLSLSLSPSLSRSISCLFTHPNVCNILVSIYRACGMKCVCACVFVYVRQLCTCVTLCIRMYMYVGSLEVFFFFLKIWYVQHCINDGTLIRPCNIWNASLWLFRVNVWNCLAVS